MMRIQAIIHVNMFCFFHNWVSNIKITFVSCAGKVCIVITAFKLNFIKPILLYLLHRKEMYFSIK